MYMRSYEEEKIPVPESYGGTAFSEKCEIPSKPEEAEAYQASAIAKGRDIGGQLFSPILKLFNKDGFNMPHLGTEEIILLATAAFLLFGKEHDIECALLLVALVFIT